MESTRHSDRLISERTRRSQLRTIAKALWAMLGILPAEAQPHVVAFAQLMELDTSNPAVAPETPVASEQVNSNGYISDAGFDEELLGTIISDDEDGSVWAESDTKGRKRPRCEDGSSSDDELLSDALPKKPSKPSKRPERKRKRSRSASRSISDKATEDASKQGDANSAADIIEQMFAADEESAKTDVDDENKQKKKKDLGRRGGNPEKPSEPVRKWGMGEEGFITVSPQSRVLLSHLAAFDNESHRRLYHRFLIFMSSSTPKNYKTRKISTLCKRCLLSDATVAFTKLESLINHLQFYIKSSALLKSKGEGITELAEMINKEAKMDLVDRDKVDNMRSFGAKIACLVSGGTLYILVMVAVVESAYGYLRKGRVDIITKACLALRRPSSVKSGTARKLIESCIIPSIWYISQTMRISCHTYDIDEASACFQETRQKKIQCKKTGKNYKLTAKECKSYYSKLLLSKVWSHQIYKCDRFFPHILKNTIKFPPRDDSIWKLGREYQHDQLALKFPIPSGPDDSFHFLASESYEDFPVHRSYTAFPDPVIIKCDYDIDHEDNKKCPVTSKSSKEWTEEQRAKCEEDIAKEGRTVESEEKLQEIFEEEKKTPIPQKIYIQMRSARVQGKVFKFVSKDEKFLACLINTYPAHKREKLAGYLDAIHHNFHIVDSKVVGYHYVAGHYVLYFRMTPDATDASEAGRRWEVETGQEAMCTGLYKRNAKGKNTWIDPVSMLPRTSKETEENHTQFLLLKEALSDLFEYIHDAVESLLGEEFTKLDLVVKDLPLGDVPIAAPFGGFVLNLNTSTNAHRDEKDHTICVVVPFGSWTGGQLVLYELALVLDLDPGDILIFRSDKITHFNLHMVGKRGSIVLNTDRDLGRWVENAKKFSYFMENKGPSNEDIVVVDENENLDVSGYDTEAAAEEED